MAYVSAAEAPVFSLPGFEFRGLTAPSRGAQEICTWHLHVAPAATSDAHSLNHEEVFVMLEGQLVVSIDDIPTTLTPGDAIVVPAGAQLRLANSSSSAAHALVCVAAGFQAIMADGQSIGTPPWAQ